MGNCAKFYQAPKSLTKYLQKHARLQAVQTPRSQKPVSGVRPLHMEGEELTESVVLVGHSAERPAQIGSLSQRRK